jgi:hypothetical protein
MRGRRMLAAGSLAVMVSGLVLATPGRALGSAPKCRPLSSGFDVATKKVKWTTVERFDAINGSSKPSAVTWTVTRSESRSYTVSGEVGVDALFDFLRVSVNSGIERSWTSAVGQSFRAAIPPHSRALGVYQVGVQHASGSQWYCDFQGKKHRTPYKASAPFGTRFIRTR